MTYIFIDTNVCLHFKRFDLYPWMDHLIDKGNITLVITHPLIAELDKKKYSDKKHLKNRAIATLRAIEYLENIESDGRYKYELFNEIIASIYLEQQGLDPSDDDDKIIAAILKYKEVYPERSDILFVTNDLGPRLKSRKYNIKCDSPISEHQLNSPDTELQKNIKKLKFQNERLKSLIPKLTLTFNDNSCIHTASVEPITTNPQKFIDDKMNLKILSLPKLRLKEDIEKERIANEERRKNSAENGEEVDSNSLGELIRNLPDFGIGRISYEDKEKYNECLKTYFSEYQLFLYQLLDHKRTKSLTVEFQFELNNDGTTPADDIDLYLHFPDGFELYNQETYPESPIKPEPPNKPVSMFSQNHMLPIPNFYPPSTFGMSSDNVLRPKVTIKKTNSYDVNFHVASLKHNTSEKLEKLYIVFDDYTDLFNFNVKYEIRCSNIPEVVTGELNFVNILEST